MKKLKYLLLVLLLVSVFALNKTVNAEEEDTSSSATTDEVIEDTPLEDIEFEETTNESELQVWVYANLGWLVGIPTGTALTAIVELVVLHKKSKKQTEATNETKEQNAKTKTYVNKTKELVSETKALAKSLETNVKVGLENILKTEDLFKSLATNLTNIVHDEISRSTATTQLLEVRIANLEKVIEMVALHTKELVCNGTAEEISKTIRG